ncbi:hypothetical protein M9Y10_010623 [Tritrichomonas musculus]|uniref:Uncharacterized protein n=1 Tax=Tritrichomonas musculus TaxID=1915356 RepID=A0ABR2IM78_9EUKA
MPIKSSLKKLIEKCRSNDPEERPNFGEIIEWLTNKIKTEDCFIDGVDTNKIKDYIEEINEYFVDQKLHDTKPILSRPRMRNKANILFFIDPTKCNKDILQSIFTKVEDIAFAFKVCSRSTQMQDNLLYAI